MFHFPQEKCILNKLKYINYQQQHNYQQHKPSAPVNIRQLDGATSATDITEHLNTRSPAGAGIANRPLVFLGFFLIFGSNTPTWSVEALRTLRPQDTSDPRHFGTGASAPVPKCLKTLWHRYRNVSRQFGKVRRPTAGESTQTCPCGPMCSGPCPAASPHYASCVAFVGRRHKRLS